MLAAGAARAQDVKVGKAIARVWCSNCHLVDPQEQRTARDGVPTFLASARPQTLSYWNIVENLDFVRVTTIGFG